MKNLIMIVEDNPDVLLNLQTTLEANGYEVVTAVNGKKGVEVLETLERSPDLILSDIMMPEMNGYDFFKKVSDMPRSRVIPFLFLTAKATPEDIRLGKMLGVDDYLTKPIRQDDLLASIAGKISRSKTIKQQLEERLGTLLGIPSEQVIQEREDVVLLAMKWSDAQGPELDTLFAKRLETPYMEQVGTQLFYSAVALYGQDKIQEAQGILLNIQNIKKMGYIFFDAADDATVKRGQRPFMLAAIAPFISYFQTLRLKEIFLEIAAKIKVNNYWDIKKYWEQTAKLLSSSVKEDAASPA